MSGAGLNGSGFPATKTQEWFRAHSQRLFISFRASSLIEHGVTKGESREHQILDVLKLLPRRIYIGKKVTIIDHSGIQSPSFDAVLFDRISWPLLWEQDETSTVMIESVLAAMEIKSSLSGTDLKDIFGKTAGLRALRCVSGSPFACPPLVTAFAYKCPNTNLSFFDFSVSYWKSPSQAPSLICILNQGLFGTARADGPSLVPEEEPTDEHVPVFYRTGEDTLLVYVYFLSRWTSPDSGTAGVFTKYSRDLFSGLGAFYFEKDFLNAICSGQEALTKARQCFTRRPREGIESLYVRARERLNLQTGRSS